MQEATAPNMFVDAAELQNMETNAMILDAHARPPDLTNPVHPPAPPFVEAVDLEGAHMV